MSLTTPSPAAIASNRANARKSTGPRTVHGKAVAARNALRHGIFAKDLLLAGESADELLELKTATIQRLNPRDSFELELVERVVVAFWKLRRLQRFEKSLYQQQSDLFAMAEGYDHREEYGLGHREPIPSEVTWQDGGKEFQQKLDRIENHQHRLENALHRALRQLEKAKKQQIDPPGEFAEQALSKERTDHENRQNEAEQAEQLTRADQLLEAKIIRQQVRDRRANPVKDEPQVSDETMTLSKPIHAMRAAENPQDKAGREDSDEQLG